jgi:hypothetical protein
MITLLDSYCPPSLILQASKDQSTPEQIRLVKEIRDRLNLSFQCEFSVFIGRTRKFAMANSSGVIIVDRAFLQSSDRDRVFFAIAHEYVHAYLQHDLRIFDSGTAEAGIELDPGKLVDMRRQFEKEADGIAARKAKQMGFSIESTIEFIPVVLIREGEACRESSLLQTPRELTTSWRSINPVRTPRFPFLTKFSIPVAKSSRQCCGCPIQRVEAFAVTAGP